MNSSGSCEVIIKGEITQILSNDMQRKMKPLMGILSEFVVERVIGKYLDGNGNLKGSDLDDLIQEIVDESLLLIGPLRSNELKNELDQIKKIYCKEE